MPQFDKATVQYPDLDVDGLTFRSRVFEREITPFVCELDSVDDSVFKEDFASRELDDTAFVPFGSIGGIKVYRTHDHSTSKGQGE